MQKIRATVDRARLTSPPHRLGLVLHPARNPHRVLEITADWAERRDAQVVATGGPQGLQPPPRVEFVAEHAIGSRCDLLVAAGGDGTVLSAMRLAAPRGLPVLGVDLGSLGYLAEVDASELGAALDSISVARYRVETRGALQLIGGGNGSTIAFNDIVLRRPSGARRALLALRMDGELFTRHSGDGLIVSTSTGSTAYSFSAGGPIVSPRLSATVVTPLAPYAPLNRSVILSAVERLEVALLEDSSRLSVEVDGNGDLWAEPGQRLSIVAIPGLGRLVRFDREGFAAHARRKLGVVESPELEARKERP